MKRVKTYLLSGLLLFAIAANAQLKLESCIQEILDLEEAAFTINDSKENQTIYMNYKVQSTDWNGKVVSSNVKIYRNDDKVNFFSAQANMYKDDKNSIIVLKQQKVAIINGVPENVKQQYTDEFVEIRINLLKSCEILKCEQLTPNIKVLEIKSTLKLGGKLKIDRMIYTYDTATKKILKCRTHYDKGFQVKTMVMEYLKLDFKSDYKFTRSAKKYLVTSKGKLLAKYKGYELIDNTKEN
jgi:hypothetical protein